MKRSLFFIALFLAKLSWAQQDLNRKVIPNSPEASSLGKYAEFTPSLYTGNPGINIPLYSTKMRNHPISLSLSYSGTGIRVAEEASNVGLGWTMNAGGAVTRSVKGLPDESAAGWWNTKTMLSAEEADDPPLTSTQYTLLEAIAYGRYDTQPDVYNFNFLGSSGKFFFDDNGAVQFANFEGIKVLASPAFGAIGGTGWADDEGFIFQTTNGIKYYFGFTANSIENTDADYDATYSVSQFPTAWFLTKIVYPEGGEVLYAYNPQGIPVMYPVLSESRSVVMGGPTVVSSPCASGGGFSVSTVSHALSSLSSIDFPNERIDFLQNDTSRFDLSNAKALRYIKIYSKDLSQYIKSFEFNYNNIQGRRLSLVSVIERGTGMEEEKKHKFSYNPILLPTSYSSFSVDSYGFYNGSSNTSLISDYYSTLIGSSNAYANRYVNPAYSGAETLTRIEYPTKGYSDFEYESNQVTALVPAADTRSAALYNADAGTSSQSTTFVVTTAQTVSFQAAWSYDFYMGFEAYGASAQLINMADNSMVSVISGFYSMSGSASNSLTLYPGTYKVVVYNTDLYGTYVSTSINFTNLIEGTEYVGGLRIKRIKNYDNLGGLSIRRFEYEQPYLYQIVNGNDNWYGYTNVFCVDLNTIAETCPMVMVTSSGNMQYGAWGTDIIGYGKVTTHYGETSENGAEVSYFSKEISGGGGGFPFVQSTIHYGTGGLLLRKDIYTSTGVLKKRLANSYNNVQFALLVGYKASFRKDVPCHDAASGTGNIYDEILVQQYAISSQWVTQLTARETDYFGTDSVFVMKNFYYDNVLHRQLSREEWTDSKGLLRTKLTTYPQDYASGTTFIDNMVAEHLTALPIEQVQYTFDGATRHIVGGSVTEYHNGGKGLLHKSYVLETIAPIVSGLFKFSNGSLGAIPSPGGYVKDAGYRLVTSIPDYDSFGNPLTILPADGPATSYIWSYNNQYPVAEIKNAAYDEVAIAVGGSTVLTDFAALMKPTPIQRNSLFAKLHSNLPNALITTFVYDPLFGVSAQTDAKGMTTNYEYDNMQRLISVKDHNGNIIKTYEYHYKP